MNVNDVYCMLQDSKLAALNEEFKKHRFNLVASLAAGGQFVV